MALFMTHAFAAGKVPIYFLVLKFTIGHLLHKKIKVHGSTIKQAGVQGRGGFGGYCGDQIFSMFYSYP